MTPSSGSINLLEQPTELRKTMLQSRLPVYDRILKGPNGQPDEMIHEVRSRGLLNTGASVPMEFGVGHTPGTWIHSDSPTLKLSEAHSSGNFLEASFCRHD